MTCTQAAEALDGMVHHLLAHAANRDNLNHLVAALDTVQHLCWAMVRLVEIPEPNHLGPVGKALAASVVERLAEVYGAPPHNQPQTAPAWCATVPASPAVIWLIAPEWADGVELNPAFARRNIMALANFLAFA